MPDDIPKAFRFVLPTPLIRFVGLLVTLALSTTASLLPGQATSETCERLALEEIISRIVPNIDSFSLPNGLRVHLVRRAEEQTVTVRIAYDVGARDEPPGRGGVAHLFEHMMFKGSEEIPDGGHFRLVRDAGGRVNAATDYDSTEYWNTVPREAVGQVLFAEADRMRSIRITDSNLANQRAAIQEEGLGLANIPYVAAATEFGLELWEDSPYGHSPIGTDEEIKAMTVAEARLFHADYYVPSNAVLVVVGGFDVERVRENIEQNFGSIPGGRERPHRDPFEIDRRQRIVVLEDPLAPFPVYAVVWHGVGAREPDALELGVIDNLLMGHANARFSRAIHGALAIDAYSASFAFRDVGLLNFVFAPRTFASFDEIQHEIRREIENLRTAGPLPAELCESRRQEQLERLAGLETNDGVAAAIARGVLTHGDAHFFEEELQRLEDLDREDVRVVAERYLVDEFLTLEIKPTGTMRWLKPVLEFLPPSVGTALEEMLL